MTESHSALMYGVLNNIGKWGVLYNIVLSVSYSIQCIDFLSKAEVHDVKNPCYLDFWPVQFYPRNKIKLTFSKQATLTTTNG